MKTEYIIQKYTTEVEKTLIIPGCTYEDGNPKTVGKYATKEEALEALGKLKTRIKPLGVKVCRVTEYVAYCITLDNDGDYYCSSVLDFTKPEIYVETWEANTETLSMIGDRLGPFDTWKTANYAACQWERERPFGKSRLTKMIVYGFPL
jgi:hypothetical protein